MGHIWKRLAALSATLGAVSCDYAFSYAEQRSGVLMAASQRHVQMQAHTELLVMLTEHHLGCLQVFAKGAKFSMFKPAEEMVYIGLDEQSRTKGKAAIDVAGAQTGKSMGSVLQQVVNGKHMHV